jgi:hypothetical protein
MNSAFYSHMILTLPKWSLSPAGRQRVSAIVFRLSNTRSAHVIERLEHVLNESAAALENGVIISVQEYRHQVRLLPIGRQP